MTKPIIVPSPWNQDHMSFHKPFALADGCFVMAWKCHPVARTFMRQVDTRWFYETEWTCYKTGNVESKIHTDADEAEAFIKEIAWFTQRVQG